MPKKKKILTVKGRVRKYDWRAIKAEFMSSDAAEVKGFIQEKLGVWHAGASKATTGWSKEKDAMRKAQFEEATKLENEKKTEQLRITLNNIMAVVMDRFNIPRDQLKTLGHKEVKSFYEIVKTELGQPTRVIQNNNINRDVPTLKSVENELEDAKTKLKEEGIIED